MKFSLFEPRTLEEYFSQAFLERKNENEIGQAIQDLYR